jgi:transcriptional regulator with GAF, ATPase, and Fis domain
MADGIDVRIVSSLSHKVRQAVIEALQYAVVSIGVCRLGPGENTPVYVVGGCDDQVLDTLRQATQGAKSRVLVIYISDTELPCDQVWALLGTGVTDVMSWQPSQSASCARQVANRLGRWRTIDQLLESPLIKTKLVGSSPAWRSALRRLVEIAHFSHGSLLLLGETGTGKENAANLVHALDSRPDKREMVVIDCTTVVPELSGSEFFGHERGAFTGAFDGRKGAFALADGGTLFLDEIGELPLPQQAQLLRAFQEQKYKRVGGNQWHETRFRLICATHRDLAVDVEAGRFRADLYYRLAMYNLHLPPLRERPQDILPLVRHFLAELSDRQEPPELSPAVAEFLQTRPYPGNVRELRQLVFRIGGCHSGDGPLTVGDIPIEDRPLDLFDDLEWQDEHFENAIRRALAHGLNLKKISQRAADTAVRIALDDEDGNLQRAARRLGVTDRALQMRRGREMER